MKRHGMAREMVFEFTSHDSVSRQGHGEAYPPYLPIDGGLPMDDPFVGASRSGLRGHPSTTEPHRLTMLIAR